MTTPSYLYTATVVTTLANSWVSAARLADEHSREGRTHYADIWYGRAEQTRNIATALGVLAEVEDELYLMEGGPE